MRVSILAIAALVGLLGSPSMAAEDIIIFIARQNIDQDLKQDEVVKPRTQIQTRAGGLVVLLESETVTRSTKDRNGQKCLYWTVIPANTTHVVRSSEGSGCGNDTTALDRALASAESGEGQLVQAAFSVVFPPAVGKGDIATTTESEKAASKFMVALREIPRDPPNSRETWDVLIQPRINEQMIEMMIQGIADAPRTTAEAEKAAALEKEKAAKAAEEKKKREEKIMAAREAEERRRKLEEAGKLPRDGSSRKSTDPDTASPERKVAIAMAVIKGTSIADLSAATGLSAATIEDWHTRFVASGRASLEGTAPSECEEAISELREKLGEMFIENERLREGCG